MRQEIHWHRTAPPAPECVELQGDVSADVVIVGAGLTGLRTAITLAEAGTDTIVIDAERIGFGASGRSGGQCNPIWRATPDALREKFGNTQADRLIQTTLSAADDLFDDIRRYKIDCGAEQNGWVQAAHTAKAARGLEDLCTAWTREGAPITPLGRDETHAAVGSAAYDFALLHAKGGFVHPLALTRGFARTAQAAGAHLFELTPATGITRAGKRWQITSPKGRISAEQIVLTTNAYTDNLWPSLRQTILPMFSIALATAPLSTAQQQAVLPGRRTISDTRLAIYFARYDADNRLIFGCIGSSENAADWGGLGRLRRGLVHVFPALKGIDIECSWGGRIGVTDDMMPRLHAPAPGVLAGLGFSGRGIAMTSVMGRCLAQKILGGNNDDLPFPVSEITPMPLHALTSRTVPLMAPTLAIKDQTDVILDRTGPGRRS